MATAAPSSIDLSPSRERDDYVRISRLIISGGTTVFRALFDTYHPPADLNKNLNNAKFKSDLKSAGLTAPQRQILYPASGDPVSKNFDLSLLYKLLRNICGLTEPACKWNGCPLDGDISLEDDIVRLRNYRNEVYGHVLEDMAISWDEFNKYWEDISKALNRINNASSNKLDPRSLEEQMLNLKYDSITQDEKHDILKEIKETLHNQVEALDRLENKGDEIYKKVDCLHNSVIQLTEQVIMNTTLKQQSINFSNNTIINSNIILIYNVSGNANRSDISGEKNTERVNFKTPSWSTTLYHQYHEEYDHEEEFQEWDREDEFEEQDHEEEYDAQDHEEEFEEMDHEEEFQEMDHEEEFEERDHEEEFEEQDHEEEFEERDHEEEFEEQDHEEEFEEQDHEEEFEEQDHEEEFEERDHEEEFEEQDHEEEFEEQDHEEEFEEQDHEEEFEEQYREERDDEEEAG